MINTELIHNPYLLETVVRFNGKMPLINSQVEKYIELTLKDWVEKVPQIFHDEMNGYDFELYFTGTRSDFESLCNTFTSAGITSEMVLLNHKNEIDDSETKSREIDALIQWLRDNPNRKFDIGEFHSANKELFDGVYPYVVISGQPAKSIHPQVGMEFVKNAEELKGTVLTNTPILFYIDYNTVKGFRDDLNQILHRRDVCQKQLFFMIHPMLNTEQIKRVITDLGVESPQVVSSYDAEEVLRYLRDYPITEYVREAIKVFKRTSNFLAATLEIENVENECQNAEIHAIIDRIEQQIRRLKQTDISFVERDYFGVGHAFSDLLDSLKERILTWRNRKTKVVGEAECAKAALEYDKYIAECIVMFTLDMKKAYSQIADNIRQEFKSLYVDQGMDVSFVPPGIVLSEIVTYPIIPLAEQFVSLKEVTFEEQKYDIKAFLGLSASKDDKALNRVVTCYYSKWRDRAFEIIIPAIGECLSKNFDQLCNYYNELANSYHLHLLELIAKQETEKDRVSSQLSEDEQRLQDDNDWFAQFKDKLEHIERG